MTFKGYAIPGPRVPGAGLAEFANIPADQSLDALSGRFRIFQYREGHRYSTDDLLVAWYGTTYAPAAARVLDLGSGIGSVGMTAAWRLPGAQFVTIEAQSRSVALARKSARYNGIEARYEIREGDFREPGALGADERFDLILGSPPYFPLEGGLQSSDDQKKDCRFEVRGTLHDYARIAAAHLSRGGMFACVFPVDPPFQEKRVLEAAADAGLTILRRRNVSLKEGTKPMLGVFLMILSEDLPEAFRKKTWVDPVLTIRRKDGSVDPEYSVVKMSIGFPP